MPYAANVINVMIASPGDVEAERQIARDVVDEWNTMHAERSGIVLMALGWDTHSSPELGDRPQGIINAQVLRRADILLAIFHTRLGTPTGFAKSGTAEEIERHVAAGRAAMLYFSNVAIKPDAIDVEQRRQLIEFRESMKPRGIVEGFDDREIFRDKLRRQLNDQVHRHFGDLGGQKAITGEDSSPFVPLDPVAATLLFHASNDKGRISLARSLNGASVRAGGIDLAMATDPRATAKWREGVKPLLTNGLIAPSGNGGDHFDLTAAGWSECDRLREASFVPASSDARTTTSS